MSNPIFPEIEREISDAADKLLPATPHRPQNQGASRRSRMTLAAGAVLGAAGLAVGLTANPAVSAVAVTSAELSKTIPALDRPASAIPAPLVTIFAGTNIPSPDATANLALARPIQARIPGGDAGWVVPTETGACLTLFDATKSVSVSCSSTAEIRDKGLAVTIRGARPGGQEAPGTLEIGIGGQKAGPDGSFPTGPN